MIFNLPPLLGFLPLIVYLILVFKGVSIIGSLIVSIIMAAILTGQTLLSFTGIITNSLGSFMSLIGFVIIMGAGLGKVLTQTKVAHTFVHFILRTVGIKTQKQATIAIIVAGCLLTAMLGTSSGAVAIMAPIVIPICASLGFTRNTVGVVFQGAVATGLFLGPFTPAVVTTLGLSGVPFSTYLIHVGIPISVLIWLSTYFMSQRIQKATEKDPNNFYTKEDYDSSEEFTPTKVSKRGTIVFLLAMLVMVIIGMVVNGGAAFALMIIFVSGAAMAIACRVKYEDFINWMIEGSTVLISIWLAFLLYDPFVNLVSASGAFTAIAELVKPLIDAGGTIIFTIITTFIGVFGITGAAVAQEQILHSMFLPTAQAIGFPMHIWALILLVGSQITSFVIPGSDLIAPMGLARSNDLKSMLKNGYVIAALTIAYVVIRGLFV